MTSTYHDDVKQLDELHKALAGAGLPEGVKVERHPQHVMIVAAAGDFVAWWAPYLGGVFKIEGQSASHRAGTVRQAVDAIRRLVAP